MSDMTTSDFAALSNWKEEKWVVLTPSGKSELGDILFKTNPFGLILQIFGGLDRHNVLLVTDNEGKARKLAAVLLTIQDGEFSADDLVKAVREA